MFVATDLLIGGIEASLWVAEQWAADIRTIFPQLNVVTISANKYEYCISCALIRWMIILFWSFIISLEFILIATLPSLSLSIYLSISVSLSLSPSLIGSPLKLHFYLPLSASIYLLPLVWFDTIQFFCRLLGLGSTSASKAFFPGSDAVLPRRINENTCVLMISQSGEWLTVLLTCWLTDRPSI